MKIETTTNTAKNQVVNQESQMAEQFKVPENVMRFPSEAAAESVAKIMRESGFSNAGAELVDYHQWGVLYQSSVTINSRTFARAAWLTATFAEVEQG